MSESHFDMCRSQRSPCLSLQTRRITAIPKTENAPRENRGVLLLKIILLTKDFSLKTRIPLYPCICGSDGMDPCTLQLQRWEPPGLVPASTASLPSLLHQPSLPSRQSTSRCCSSSRTVGSTSTSALPLHPLPHFPLSSA